MFPNLSDLQVPPGVVIFWNKVKCLESGGWKNKRLPILEISGPTIRLISNAIEKRKLVRCHDDLEVRNSGRASTLLRFTVK